MNDEVGAILGGSLTKGLEVRLDPGKVVALGQYVMAALDGEAGTLLGMVTDIVLKAAESGSTSWPPPATDDATSRLLRDVLLDTAVYTQADVTPYLEVRAGAENSRARRLPRHFARVARADQATLDSAFDTGERDALRLGAPLGMDDVMVHVDLERLFERSAGVFGKSGTGKSVITFQVLDAMVAAAANAATNRERTVALVFDMHNDYGWEMKFQGEGNRRGLKARHPQQVSLFTLEANAVNSDGAVVIGTRDVTPDDLEVLKSTSFITDQALEIAREASERFGPGWFDEIAAIDPSAAVIRKAWKDGDEPEEMNWNRVAARLGFAAGTLTNLQRNLRSLRRRDFVQSGSGQFSGVIERIIQTLQGGKSVVIQFGRFGNDLTSYMLVANMLSRRIWNAYQRDMDAAGGNTAKEPNRLVIVIEEAHKFVDKSLAGQSTFGQIARELRKYNVTLFVIDQRPSQIDSEVLSQIGTKFCFQLDSEADVDALIGGMAGRAGLRQVIAALESKRQALAFGHALPMPVVVRPPDLTANFPAGGSLRARLGVVASVNPKSALKL